MSRDRHVEDLGDPREILREMLNGELARLEERRTQLAEIGSVLSQLPTLDAAAHPLPESQPAWEPMSDEMAAPMIQHLAMDTEGLIRNCVVTLEVGPGLDEGTIRSGRDRMRRGLRRRTLYPLSVVETPAGQRWLRSWGDAGEEQRVLANPPTDFAVFGDKAVMAVVGWGDAESGYVLIRHPMLVAAFTSLFDALFDLALPVPEDGGATDEERRLLGLMALGVKDEAIARYLGWSLRTVRRRVARLMERQGVQTRFQLGACAVRDDLVVVGARHVADDGPRRAPGASR